ncbi:hypothetical protein BD779DRAFT_1673049 [Infundibulicybe gibba]|nr:hypothetical protein BD779DRAFT_1673049 [Infundibulicybe gibba]
MSHKWTSNAIGILSERAMEQAKQAIQVSPWHISHDNVNVPLRVFSQRINNQNHFVSGTAATVWILPQRAALPPDANPMLQKFRAMHSNEVFDYHEVLYGTPEADHRLEAQYIHRILRVLLDSPDFKDYKDLTHSAFDTPPPVCELECGPDNVTQQYILGTCTIEEASYDGTLKVMDEWFKQLGLDSKEEERKTAHERIIAWLGDQLTVERLRGLWKYRHADHNSFDRMDYMIPVFGWFHLLR